MSSEQHDVIFVRFYSNQMQSTWMDTYKRICIKPIGQICVVDKYLDSVSMSYFFVLCFYEFFEQNFFIGHEKASIF